MSGLFYPDLTRCTDCAEWVDTVWSVDGTGRRLCLDCLADVFRMETPQEKQARLRAAFMRHITGDQEWPGATA